MREIAVSSVLTILPFLIPFTEAIKGVPDDEADDMISEIAYGDADLWQTASYLDKTKEL
jgi:hypothetical protein